MALLDNVKLELYIATNKFPNRRQYEESQLVLGIIEQNGVTGSIEITRLDDLIGKQHIFSMVGDKRRERKLPYLEYTHLGVGVYSDYMGAEEVMECLKSLGLKQENSD